MVEELRFFLRTGLYASLVTIVYWFVTYEIVGTVLLGFVVVAAALFIGPAARQMQTAVPDRTEERDAPTRPRSSDGEGGTSSVSSGPAPGRASLPSRVLGFDERDQPGPLEVVDEPMVNSSAWPPAAAVAALLIALGPLYGPWFWLPGLGLGAVVSWRWLHQLGG